MIISNKQLESFKKLYFEQFGVQLDQKEAYEKAYKLLHLIELIYKPITERKFLLLKAYLEKYGDIKPRASKMQ